MNDYKKVKKDKSSVNTHQAVAQNVEHPIYEPNAIFKAGLLFSFLERPICLCIATSSRFTTYIIPLFSIISLV